MSNPATDPGHRFCIVCRRQMAHSPLFEHPIDYEYDVPAEGHNILTCDSCGLISLDPMPTTDQLLKYYPPDYCNYEEGGSSLLRASLEKAYAALQIRLVRGLIGDFGNVLDVGCATGKLISLLQEKGKWDCHGVEFQDDVAEAGRRLGRTIFTGTIESLDLKEDHYDLVILNHMIEHANDPVAFLEATRRVLKPGGKIYVETPNSACLDFSVFQNRWGCIHYPRHTYLFSKHNIRKLLENYGFTVSKTEYSLHTCGWALGLQNSLVSRFHLRRRSGRIRGYPLLLLGLLPLTFLQKLFRNGSVMRIVGTKS